MYAPKKKLFLKTLLLRKLKSRLTLLKKFNVDGNLQRGISLHKRNFIRSSIGMSMSLLLPSSAIFLKKKMLDPSWNLKVGSRMDLQLRVVCLAQFLTGMRNLNGDARAFWVEIVICLVYSSFVICIEEFACTNDNFVQYVLMLFCYFYILFCIFLK